MKFPAFTKTLAFRLFFLLLLAGIIVFVSLTVLIIRASEKQLMNEIVLGAMRTNDLIEKSIHYSMLQNRKEDVAQIIRTLGDGPGVEGIRIYNKKGNIVFSTVDNEIGHTADLKAEQCIICHGSERPLDHIPESTRPRIFTSPNGYRVLAVINPIRNEKDCSRPGCHLSPSEQKILGVLDAKMNLEHVDSNIISSRNQMILYSIIAIVLIEVLAGMFIWRMVHRRVGELSEGMRQVKSGNLQYALEDKGADELSALAKTFNQMVHDLNIAEEKNRELTQSMVQVAKMASMGKLAATVAHEINNPLGGILTYIKLLNKQISAGPLKDEERDTVSQQMDLVIDEIKRCGNIVKNMLHFSKSPEIQFEKVNIHELIEKSLFIVNNHFEINRISVVKEFGADNPVLTANANQIEQALIALFINAVEAMGNHGELSIRTLDLNRESSLQIWIRDSGKGIPDDIREKIFEPFFTTKEETHGVGLGLSVVYGIVQSHQGTIEVASRPGEGTTFIITLPRNRK